jgi:hypothetical protein
MQPTDLSPVLHGQHPFLLPADQGQETRKGVKIRAATRGQFSGGADREECVDVGLLTIDSKVQTLRVDHLRRRPAVM